MAAVLSFYQLPEEEENFLKYVEGSGKILAVPSLPMRSREDLRPLPFHEFIHRFDPDVVYFGLEEHANLIVVSPYLDEQGEFVTVNNMRSPLVHYRRPRWRDPKRLTMSNLVAYWSYPDEKKTAMLDQPREFVKWAKKIYQQVRKIAPPLSENKFIRVTPGVEAAMREGVTLGS